MIKVGVSYKFIVPYVCTSSLKFSFSEGTEIVFSRIGFDWKNHSEFEIINTTDVGRRFSYDPYSKTLPIIPVKDKISFSTDDFIKLIQLYGNKVPSVRVRVLYVKKGERVHKYPCSGELIQSDNCFMIVNYDSGYTYVDTKHDAKFGFNFIMGLIKHTFSGEFKVEKLFPVGQYGYPESADNYADTLFCLTKV